MKETFKLSLNTGCIVNRYTDPETFLRFVKEKLKINYIQPTSDWLSLYLPKKITLKNISKLNKSLKKHDIKVNSLFTGAFTRLNHLAHEDKEHQTFWIKWFKNFIDIGIDIGANHVGSHLGILSYDDNKKRLKILNERVIKNWFIIAEYAQKKKLKSLIWEPMSIAREFGETLNQCQYIQKSLNKRKFKFDLCLDVGHGDIKSKNKKDYDPYEWLKKFGSESPVIHLKQVKKNNFNHMPFTKTNNKDGIIQPDKIIKILKNQKNYTAELAFELSFKEREPMDSNLKRELKQTIKYWKEFL
tara:strand:- start:494 stop:1393 length:900 start_codon:yes stop_codon:yes gene_type:complete